jgi:Leucine-rich repeat (LRR) protein
MEPCVSLVRPTKLTAVSFRIKNLKTLDLSKNSLRSLNPKISVLVNLKSLNLEQNQLPAGSLVQIAKLSKLQKLSVGGNLLGKHVVSENPATAQTFPSELPPGLKQLKVNNNFLSSVPRSILSAKLEKLEKLDLSSNQLAAIPREISNLVALTELNLDNNVMVSLPDEIGRLKKLKVLSLRGNYISVHSTIWSETNPQPLPQSLFVDTPIIDLNLHGNPMTTTQLNTMEGFDVFLERRQKVKTSTLLGGGLTNLDVCGLE